MSTYNLRLLGNKKGGIGAIVRVCFWNCWNNFEAVYTSCVVEVGVLLFITKRCFVLFRRYLTKQLI